MASKKPAGISGNLVAGTAIEKATRNLAQNGSTFFGHLDTLFQALANITGKGVGEIKRDFNPQTGIALQVDIGDGRSVPLKVTKQKGNWLVDISKLRTDAKHLFEKFLRSFEEWARHHLMGAPAPTTA